MNYSDSAAEAVDVAQGRINPSPHLTHRATEGPLFVKPITTQRITKPTPGRDLYYAVQHAYTILPFPFRRSGRSSLPSLRPPARHSTPFPRPLLSTPTPLPNPPPAPPPARHSTPFHRALLSTPTLVPNGTPVPLSRQNVKQFSSPSSLSHEKRMKHENTNCQKTKPTREKSQRLTGKFISNGAENCNGCRIVAAPPESKTEMT